MEIEMERPQQRVAQKKAKTKKMLLNLVWMFEIPQLTSL